MLQVAAGRNSTWTGPICSSVDRSGASDPMDGMIFLLKSRVGGFEGGAGLGTQNCPPTIYMWGITAFRDTCAAKLLFPQGLSVVFWAHSLSRIAVTCFSRLCRSNPPFHLLMELCCSRREKANLNMEGKLESIPQPIE